MGRVAPILVGQVAPCTHFPKAINQKVVLETIAASKGRLRCTVCEGNTPEPGASVWICLTCGLPSCGHPSDAATHIGHHLWYYKSHKLVVKLADYSQGFIMWCSHCLKMVEPCFVLVPVRTLFHRIRDTFKDLEWNKKLRESDDNPYPIYRAAAARAALLAKKPPVNKQLRVGVRTLHPQLSPSNLRTTQPARQNQPRVRTLPTGTEDANLRRQQATKKTCLENTKSARGTVGPCGDATAVPTSATGAIATADLPFEPPDVSTPISSHAGHAGPTNGPTRVGATTPPQASVLDNNNNMATPAPTRSGTNPPITPTKTGPEHDVGNSPEKRNNSIRAKKRLQIDGQPSTPTGWRRPVASQKSPASKQSRVAHVASPRCLRTQKPTKRKSTTPLDTPVTSRKLVRVDSRLLTRRIALTKVVVEPRTEAEKVRGLTNLGSTCFLNAILQCLACSNQLISVLLSTQQYILKGNPRLQVPDLSILAELKRDSTSNVRWVLSVLLRELRQAGVARRPRDLINVLKVHTNDKFDFDRHQDAQEIFTIITSALDTELHECLKDQVHEKGTKRDYYFQQIWQLGAESTQVFTGQWEKVIYRCSTPHDPKSTCLEPFTTWSLALVAPRDVPQTSLPSSCKLNQQDKDSSASSSIAGSGVSPKDDEVTIESCLQAFTAPQEMGDKDYKCNVACTKKKAHVSLCLVDEPPATLVLHLKRAKKTGFDTFEKISTPVSFKPVLDLAPFCTKKAAKSPRKYSLFGVVSHSGSLSSGHYIAYIKLDVAAGDQSTDQDAWFKCDDSRTSRANTDDVFSAEPYMLFYKRLE